MFGFGVSYDTLYLLVIMSRYHLIFDMLYVTFQGYHFGVLIVIVYKTPVSLRSVFKTWYFPDLEKPDCGRENFQYNRLNVCVFCSLREPRPNLLSY